MAFSTRCLLKFILCHCITCMSAGQLMAEDFTKLGGDLTSFFDGRFALQLPAPNVVDEERRNLMLTGFSIFHARFTQAQGLGPQVVNNSCGGCHVNNGRGSVKISRSPYRFNAMVIKVGLPGSTPHVVQSVPGIGDVLTDSNVTGKKRFHVVQKWRTVHGRYPDGNIYKLQKPYVQFRIPGQNSRKLLRSLRMTPAVIGPGLLESIPEAAVLSLSDPFDLNGDGISGRPNFVTDKRNDRIAIGRFGFKAGNPTVEQQSLAAFFNEMGVTSETFRDDLTTIPEFSDENLPSLLFYQRLAGVPAARRQGTSEVQTGYKLFNEISCSSCHVSTLMTGTSLDPELSFQTIHPFSDLLLHDMGLGLADHKPEGLATGREWRTTPLWGLGFSKHLSTVRQRFLHDGRARTIEEAVLWHGGEAKKSQAAFKALSETKRQALIQFLESL